MGIKRLFAAGGTLLLGCAAAGPFYQPTVQSSHQTNKPEPLLALRQEGELTVKGPAPLKSESILGRSGTTENHPLPTAAIRRSLGIPATATSKPRPGRPPKMADSFADAMQKQRVARAEPAVMVPPVSRRVRYAQPKQTSDRSRTHLVRDGDSLQSISQRYYGTAVQAEFIYEQNASQLTSPDLLPIGLRLVVPRRTPIAGPSREPLKRRDGLVPVRWPS